MAKSSITEAKIRRFVKIRNKSPFASNLQFWSDLHEAKINSDEMPEPDKGHIGNLIAYRWRFPFGDLIEFRGEMWWGDKEIERLFCHVEGEKHSQGCA